MNPVIVAVMLWTFFVAYLVFKVAPKFNPSPRTLAVVNVVGVVSAAGMLGFAIAADSVLLWVIAGIVLLSQYPICLMPNNERGRGPAEKRA